MYGPNKLLKLIYLVMVLAPVYLAGCATTAHDDKKFKIFFPAPPSPPRIQYLTSYTAASDIEAPPSGFDQFVTGSTGSRKRLDKPYGAAIHQGRIFVCDTNDTLMVFDLNINKFYPLFGARGLGKLVQPLNINIGEDGTKYVTDPVRNQVVAYSANDNFLKAYGNNKLNWKPTDAFPFKDRLYVVNAKKDNPEVVVFDLESGKKIKSIGKTGEPIEKLGLPTNITIDNDGILYVTDVSRMQVVKYDLDGHHLGQIGSPGQEAGHFVRPRGVKVSRDGHVYVVDAAFDNVQIFTKEGQLLMWFGGHGYAPSQLYLPASIYIDYDNIELFRKYADPNFEIEYLVMVINQFGKQLVNVFGFGKMKGKTYQSIPELEKELRESLTPAPAINDIPETDEQEPEKEPEETPAPATPEEDAPEAGDQK